MTGTREGHLAALAELQAAEERAVKQCIVDELAEAMPALQAAADQAEAAIREACTALGEPEKRLADLEAEIEDATGRAAEWQGKLSSLKAEDRVEARVRFQAWNEELDRLREKRDQAERDLQPYYQARSKAEADLELAQGAQRGLAWTIVRPYESPVAQGTKAYLAFRAPRLSFVLLAGDRAHPEWDAAVAQLDQDATAAGFRLDRSPDAEREARAMTAEMSDAASTPFAPSPSGQDVMAMDKAMLANDALQQSPTRIDDFRNPRTAPPRNTMVEEYRQVQSLRDLGLR